MGPWSVGEETRPHRAETDADDLLGRKRIKVEVEAGG